MINLVDLCASPHDQSSTNWFCWCNLFQQGWLRWSGYSLTLRSRNTHARVVALTSAFPMPARNEYVQAGSCIRTNVRNHSGSATSMDVGTTSRVPPCDHPHGVQYARMGAIWPSPGIPLPLNPYARLKSRWEKYAEQEQVQCGLMQPSTARSSNIYYL